MAILAEPVVLLLFGPQWMEVVPSLRCLCVAAAVMLLTSISNLSLMAVGGAVAVLRARLTWLPIHAVFLIAGSRYGLVSTAIALAASSLVICVLLCIAMRRAVGVTFTDHARIVRDSAPLAGGAMLLAAPALMISGDSIASGVLSLGCGSLGAVLGFGSVLLLTRHPLRLEFARVLVAVRGQLGR